MSGLLGIHPKIRANKLAGIQIQSSASGIVIPIVYGQARVPGNLLWYSDFDPIAHTSQQSVGGKGGGAQVANTTYTYQAAIIMGIAEGPIASLVSGWVGKNKYSWSDMTALGYSLFSGASGQAPWSYVTSKHPSEALGYDLTACVVNSTWPLDSSAALSNHAWEVVGFYQVGSGILDANAADIVTDVLTSATHGTGFPLAQLGSMTLYRQYCAAAGLFISPVVIQQQPTAQHLTEWAAATNTGLVWSGGVLKFIPYGDVPLTANGQTYTPNTTPIYDLGDDDFIVSTDSSVGVGSRAGSGTSGGSSVAGTDTGVANPIVVTRKAVSDCYNHVTVSFDNRAKDYNSDIAEAKDDASIQGTGLRSLSTVALPCIKDPQIARTVAQLILQRQLYVRNTYRFKLGWKYILLEPMDLVTLTDAGLGMNKVPVRITEVSENAAGELDITAEDWPFGTASATLYAQQASTGYLPKNNVAPGDTAAPVILEGPYPVADKPRELWIAAAGVTPTTWGGCDVWMSTDGTGYQHIGQIAGPARYGTLDAALATGPTAPTTDTTNTLGVDLTISSGSLSSGSATDLATGVTLCAIGVGNAVEFLAYQTATLVSASKYNLTTLLRGLYNSPIPSSHAIGQTFVRCDQAIFRFPFPQATIGQTLHFKFTSFNPYGNSPQSLASVTAYTYVVGLGLQSGAQPSLQVVASLTNDQIDDTTSPVTLTATAANLPPSYTWAIRRGYSKGQYNSTPVWSGSNALNPLTQTKSVNPNAKNSFWYQLDIVVGSDHYYSECQVQGLMAFINPSTGNAATTAQDSTGRAVNTFYGKALPGNPDTGDSIVDGASSGITSLAARTNLVNSLDSSGLIAGKLLRSRALDDGKYAVVSSIAAGTYIDSGVSVSTGAAANKMFVKGLSGDPDTLDSAPDGTSYARTLGSRVSSGKPLIDFSEAIHINKSVDYIADGSTNQLAGGARGYQALNSSNRIADETRLPMVRVNSGGATPFYGAGNTTNPISSVIWNSGSSTYTANIAAFTVYAGSKTVSYNSGSVTGLFQNVTYYLYCDDPNFAGGSPGYYASQVLHSPTDNDGRVYVGAVTTGSGGGGSTTYAGGSAACFEGDTQISLADGTEKPIAEIVPGEVVVSFDPATGALGAKPVAAVQVHEVTSVLAIESDHGRVVTTPEHPFYLEGGTFGAAGWLRHGNYVMRLSPVGLLRAERVLSVRPDKRAVTVYNFEVEDWHTYVANGFAVHNVKLI